MVLFKFFWILFLSVVLVSCDVASNSENSRKYEFIKVSEITSEYGKPGSAFNCFVEGDYLYIAAGSGGVKIYKISDPSTPVFVSSFDEQVSYVIDVFVKGNYLYVADFEKGLLILDITQKSSPSLIKTLDLAGFVQDVYVKDSYAFVCTRNGGLYILDVSIPPQTKVVSNFSALQNPLNVTVSGNYAYVADYTNLIIIDTSLKSDPKIIGKIPAELHIENVFVNRGYLYVVDNLVGKANFKIYDLTEPTNLILKGIYQVSSISKGLYVSGNYAFLTLGYNGVDILDISDPGNVRKVKNISTSKLTHGVFVKDDFVFIANDIFGVEIFDFNKHQRLSATQVSEEPEAISVYGSKVYLALGKQGLLVYENIENNFKKVAKFAPEKANFVDILFKDNFVYVADLFSGIKIFEISDGALPVLVGEFQIDGDVRAIKVFSNYIFVSAGGRGVLILDIANPKNPNFVKELKVSGISTCLDIQDKYLYIASDFHGLEIYDISEPTNPSFLGKYNEGGQVTDLKVSGNFAYIAYYKNELHIVDVSSPKLPKKLAVYKAIQEGHKKLDVHGKLVIASDSDELQILSFYSNNLKKVGGLKLEGIKAFRIIEDYAYICSNSRNILNLYKIIQK